MMFARTIIMLPPTRTRGRALGTLLGGRRAGRARDNVEQGARTLLVDCSAGEHQNQRFDSDAVTYTIRDRQIRR